MYNAVRVAFIEHERDTPVGVGPKVRSHYQRDLLRNLTVE
jgi:hypothetical protein